MKQIFQSLKNGETIIQDTPAPSLMPQHLLIKTKKTLVSSGTERMLVDFGKANIIKKAAQQPDKVKLVIEKILSNGIKPTLESVFAKLDEPLPIGYCNVGEVIKIGKGDTNIRIGDRVVSNGFHAEVVRAPFNLCAKVPDNVTDDQAAFTVLGSIALQGIRLIKPTLGETIVVTGLGLVGQLTVQLLKANGCKVIGIDMDKTKCELAESFGAETINLSNNEDPIKISEMHTRGRGVDGVIISAATSSSEPVHQAAKMCRKRGRIVLIGVTGLELSRSDFYEKELTFQVSCSYGPGRYDPNYEDKGQDYPFGFVRWTEQRNMEAILDMISMGNISLDKLVSHRYELEDASYAYELITGSKRSLGIILDYPDSGNCIEEDAIILNTDTEKKNKKNNINLSFIGAGGYSSSTLIPAFNRSKVNFSTIASSTGMSATNLGKKYKFNQSTTNTEHVFKDDSDAVVITTRHDTHAKFVIEALKNNKSVFVEKPLCISLDELNEIKKIYFGEKCKKSSPIIMVGFNRRFSPHVKKIRELLSSTDEKKAFIMTVNAGFIPKNHWTQDESVGGGRIVGEVCHFIDLLRFLSDSPITAWNKVCIDNETKDSVSIQLKFKNGSVGVVNYLSNGSIEVSKERLEVFTGNKILQLDNFRNLSGYGWSGFSKMNLWHQDKGQVNCVTDFVNSLKKLSVSPIPFEQIEEVSRIVIEISESMK